MYLSALASIADDGPDRNGSDRTLAFSHASVRAIQYYPVIKAFYQKQRCRKPVIVARAIVAFVSNASGTNTTSPPATTSIRGFSIRSTWRTFR